MNSQNESKIKLLLRNWPKGTLGTQSWLETLGVYRQLAEQYRASGWIKKIDHGLYSLMDDQISWHGIIYTLQHQLDYKIHIAATTALDLQGYSHYLSLANATLENAQRVWLFPSSLLFKPFPRWFIKHFYKQFNMRFVRTALFTGDETRGLTTIQIENYQITIAMPERAILESISLAPNKISLQYIKELMEGMTTLRPQILQVLLEQCNSIKVKRLFLLIAEHLEHAWVKKLTLDKINLGRGKRMVGTGGYYYPKYQISLPIQLEQHEGYVDNDRT